MVYRLKYEETEKMKIMPYTIRDSKIGLKNPNTVGWKKSINWIEYTHVLMT